MGDFFIPASDLRDLLKTRAPFLLFDVRKREAFAASGRMVPGAVWRDHARVNAWAGEIPARMPVVVYCVYGHEVSQGAGARLRELGVEARVLEGGFEGWREAGGTTVPAP